MSSAKLAPWEYFDPNDGTQTRVWSHKFGDKMRSPDNGEIRKKERALLAWQRTFTSRRVARKLALYTRKRLALLPSRRYCLENIVKEPTLKLWKESDRRTFFCDVCMKPAAGQPAACLYCDIVAHVRCIADLPEEEGWMIDEEGGEWICCHCVEDFRFRDSHYAQRREEFLQRALEDKAARHIARIFRGYHMRRLYDETRALVIKTQAHVRGLCARKAYQKLHRGIRRPVFVHISGLRNFEIPPSMKQLKDKMQVWVQVSVVDMLQREIMKATTAHKLYTKKTEARKAIKIDDTILLPGVTGNVMVCLTVMAEGQNDSKTHVLGQLCVNFKNSMIYSVGKEFRNEPLSVLQVTPMECREAPMKFDILKWRERIHTTIDCEIAPQNLLNSRCGYLLGPNIDVLRYAKEKDTSLSDANIRATRWWVVFARDTLHVYSAYGSTKPSVAHDLDKLQVTRVYEKSFRLHFFELDSSHEFRANSFGDATRWLNQLDELEDEDDDQSKSVIADALESLFAQDTTVGKTPKCTSRHGSNGPSATRASLKSQKTMRSSRLRRSSTLRRSSGGLKADAGNGLSDGTQSSRARPVRRTSSMAIRRQITQGKNIFDSEARHKKAKEIADQWEEDAAKRNQRRGSGAQRRGSASARRRGSSSHAKRRVSLKTQTVPETA